MVAPIISGCFDCVMSDDRSDIMRGRACLDGRCHKTVPLAVPNNVGDRRVINNLGNLQTVVRPPTTKHLGTDVAAPRWRSSGRHPRNDRVFAAKLPLASEDMIFDGVAQLKRADPAT